MFKTQYNCGPKKGQVFTQPSLTDELADEPLSQIIKQFTLPQVVSGYLKSNSDVSFNDKTTEEEVEAAFDDFATADLPQMSKADQLAALVDAQVELERLRYAMSSKPLTEPVKPQEREAKAASIDDSVKA